ncbi:RNA-binding protein [Crocosphaera sp.]|uniref:RNA recognition motif domain-containing protein n=1 Tax=Crocosphaera sp. TaxID=2729996 RepID=UPI002629E4A8|nr:RNA-binding protein [Crocosphaera sp.]MDJ0580646.1 RNA-binding protein [Crocosphaera sp.]
MPIRLYVGNLPKDNLERQTLEELFVDGGEIVSIKVIKERKTGKCRGFAFVTVPNDELADAFIEKYNGQTFMDNPLKIEKALPRSKGKEGEEENVESKPAPTKSKKGGGKKRNNRSTSSSGGSSNESFQPDPRWADQLAQLKEMLTASSNN